MARFDIDVNVNGQASASSLDNQLKSLDKSGATAQKSLDNISSSSSSMTSAIVEATGKIWLMEKAIKSLGVIAGISDEMANLNGQLKLVTSSSSNLVTVQNELYKVSLRTHSSLKETTSLYTDLATSMGQMGKSQKEILATTETVSKAIAISGGSAQQSAAAMAQLGQAFGSGRLGGDELKSITENAKGLSLAIAEGMGVSVGALKNLGAEGKITAEVLEQALSKASNSVNEKFGKMPITIGKAITDTESMFMQLVGNIDKETGASSSLAQSIGRISGYFAENTDSIVKSASIIGEVIGGTVSGVIYSITWLVENSINGINNIFNWVFAGYAKVQNLINKVSGADQVKAIFIPELDLQSDKFKMQMETSIQKIQNIYNSKPIKLTATGLDEKGKNTVGGSTETAAEKKARLAKEAREAQKLAENTAKTEEEIYKLSHGIFESKLHDLELERAKKIKNGEDLVKIETWYNLAVVEAKVEQSKALDKIIDDRNKKLNDAAKKEADLAIKAYEDQVKLSEKIANFDTGKTATFQTTGIQAVDTSGAILNSIGQMNDLYDEQIKKLKEIQDLKDEANSIQDEEARAKALSEIAIKESKLKAKTTQNELAGIANIAGATKSFFNEKSKAYKVLSGIEKAVHIASMAMEAQKIAMSIASTAAAVTEAIAGAFVGIGPTGLVTGAAMIAALAALGLFSGGGSSGSAPSAPISTTGTVLGDASAQSESTKNIYTLMQDVHASEYKELRGINRAVTSMNDAIEKTVASMFRSGGGFQGSNFASSKQSLSSTIGGYTTKALDIANPFSLLNIPVLGDLSKMFNNAIGSLVGSFGNALFGGSSSTNLISNKLQSGSITSNELLTGKEIDAYYQGLIYTHTSGGLFGGGSDSFASITQGASKDLSSSVSLIYKSLAQTLLEVDKGLQTNREAVVRAYSFAGFSIETLGKTSEQMTKELNDYISFTGDQMINTVFGDILKQYQKLGEGLLETAVRVITEKAIVLSQLGDINQNVTGDTIALTQSLVSLSGGLSKFTDATTAYYDKFFSDAEKQANLQKKLSEIYSSFGLALPQTNSDFRAIVESIDLSTTAGQELFTTMMSIAEQTDTYTKSLKDLADAQNKLDQDAQAKRVEALRLKRAIDFGMRTAYPANNTIPSYVSSSSSDLFTAQSNTTDSTATTTAQAQVELVSTTNTTAQTIAVVANELIRLNALMRQLTNGGTAMVVEVA